MTFLVVPASQVLLDGLADVAARGKAAAAVLDAPAAAHLTTIGAANVD